MAKRDYYDILGVSRNASDKEIRQAYRRLARKYHPDVNPNDKTAEARFKEIGEAYEVLADKEKRAKYDRWGHDWAQREQAEAAARQAGFDPGGFTRTADDFEFRTSGFGGGFEDILEEILGGVGGRGRGGFRSRTRPMSSRGQDTEFPIEVTLAEAYSGGSRILQVDEPERKRLEVKIPPGVRDGSRIRMAGEGGTGFGGGPRGDLYLVVSVAKDPLFERKEDDLYVDVQVPLTTLVLGGEVQVPTPAGKRLALRVPPETQNGMQFRLAGQGVPHLHGGSRGDLYARMRAVLPTGLTRRERELFEELARLRK